MRLSVPKELWKKTKLEEWGSKHVFHGGNSCIITTPKNLNAMGEADHLLPKCSM